MLKPLAAVSILALSAHAGLFDLKDNIKAMKEASEKCNSQCGDVGKVISDHCTKLFGNCLTEVCKAASVKPCLECMKTEKVHDKFEKFCDFMGKDTSPSSSSTSASASATSSSSSSSSSSKSTPRLRLMHRPRTLRYV